MFIEAGFLALVIAIAGTISDWHNQPQVWVAVVQGIVVYLIAYWIDAVKLNKDIAFINKQLQKRKEGKK
jgi:hypothetical protein